MYVDINLLVLQLECSVRQSGAGAIITGVFLWLIRASAGTSVQEIDIRTIVETILFAGRAFVIR